MSRKPTTHDPFNAIAEPKRRALLEVFRGDELSVTELVARLDWPQPMVSKHLGVLKEVGLVDMRKDGRQRLYRANPASLKPIAEWVAPFARYWEERFEQLDELLEALKDPDN